MFSKEVLREVSGSVVSNSQLWEVLQSNWAMNVLVEYRPELSNNISMTTINVFISDSAVVPNLNIGLHNAEVP